MNEFTQSMSEYMEGLHLRQNSVNRDDLGWRKEMLTPVCEPSNPDACVAGAGGGVVAVKVLVDTDIGSDVDDAMCLAYLLSHPDCDLLGITTVSSRPAERAMLASVLCRHLGKSVPIIPGCDDPILVPQRQPLAQQAAVLERWPHETQFPDEPAIEFLRRTIHAHPHEIVLVTIGPLTNIGLLFASDPRIPSLLRGVVSMAGAYTRAAQERVPMEWNVLIDPIAAEIVFRSRLERHVCIGLDVTTRVSMRESEYREHFDTERLRPVWDMSRVWFGTNEIVTFHDPLAGAVVFEPDLCGYTRGTVNAELLSVDLRGQTHWTPDPAGRHEIATTVDPSRFLRHYFSIAGQ
jgi:purine nucleosidase